MDASLLNNHNVADIVSCLFQYGQSSRGEIADYLALRRATVGEVCDRLIAAGVVRLTDPGRARGVPLELVAERFLAAGVEHRVDGLDLCILRADGKVVVEQAIALPSQLAGARRMAHIAKAVHDRIGAIPINQPAANQPMVGVGFCDIGMVDAATGRSIRAAALPGWEDIDLRGPLEKAINLPVYLPYKLDTCCLAERVFGQAGEGKPGEPGGPGEGSLSYVMLDRGIGISAMLDGRMLHSGGPIFGELGHVVVDPAGEICRCGNRGCLETIAGVEAIVARVEKHLCAGMGPSLAGPITIGRVIDAARGGHKLAALALADAASAVGLALANVLNILGVQEVALGGALACAGDLVLLSVQQAVRQHCIFPLNTRINVRLAHVTDRPAMRGAAYHVLQQYFSALKNQRRGVAA